MKKKHNTPLIIMACGITGLAAPTNCNADMTKAGLNKRIYIGRRSDIKDGDTGYTTATGKISAISFKTYKGFKQIFGRKLSNDAEQSLKFNETNKFMAQDVVLKLTSAANDTDTIATIESLFGIDDAVVVVETNSGGFKVYGKDTGLEMTELSQKDGIKFEDDNSFMVKLTGAELGLVPWFLATDYATSKALLDSYVV